jgi:hypothetical protein
MLPPILRGLSRPVLREALSIRYRAKYHLVHLWRNKAHHIKRVLVRTWLVLDSAYLLLVLGAIETFRRVINKRSGTATISMLHGANAKPITSKPAANTVVCSPTSTHATLPTETLASWFLQLVAHRVWTWLCGPPCFTFFSGSQCSAILAFR